MKNKRLVRFFLPRGLDAEAMAKAIQEYSPRSGAGSSLRQKKAAERERRAVPESDASRRAGPRSQAEGRLAGATGGRRRNK